MKNTPRSKTWQRNAVAVAIASCFVIATPLYANPIGPSIANGVVSMAQQGNSLNITNSPGAIINWQSFSIGASEATRFIQQSAASSVLNRVTGVNPSSILGALQSNGRVFLINPNGVLFGAGAQVDVAGLVVSTLNLSNADFLAGRYNFTARAGAGGIENQGNLTALPGGQLYLVAPNINNSGLITSPQGDVILAAGNSVELVNANSPDMRVVISAPDNQAINLGSIVANSGRVGIYAGLINHHGIVSADTATVGATGKITFKATTDINLEPGSVTSASGAPGGVHDGGEVRIVADGKLAMRSGSQVHVDGGVDGGNGGFLELSGKQRIGLYGTFTGRAQAPGYRNGSLLLDPADITICAAGACGASSTGYVAPPVTLGGGTVASGDSPATLYLDPNMNPGTPGAWIHVSLAATNNISIVSAILNGDVPSGGSLTLTAGNNITVGAQIGLPSAGRFNHDLTLTAGNDININRSIYLDTNTLTLAADANVAGKTTSIGSGKIFIQPAPSNPTPVVVDTKGDLNVTGAGLQVLGFNSSSGYVVAPVTVNVGGKLNVDFTGHMPSGGTAGSGEMRLQAGNAIPNVNGGDSDASVSLNVAGGDASNNNFITVGSLTIQGGSASACGGDCWNLGNADAVLSALSAVKNIVIATTTGGVTVQGGTATAQGGSGVADAHAKAELSAANLKIDTAGTILVQGGTATATVTGNGAYAALAAASAKISVTSSLEIGNGVSGLVSSVQVYAGNANAYANGSGFSALVLPDVNAKASADAVMSAGTLTMRANGLHIRGGGAHAQAGGSYSNSSAGVFASGAAFNRSAVAESKALLQVNGSVTAMNIGGGGLAVRGGTVGGSNCSPACTVLVSGSGGANSAAADRSALISITGNLASLTVAGGGITVAGGSADARVEGAGSNTATENANAAIQVSGNLGASDGAGGRIASMQITGGRAWTYAYGTSGSGNAAAYANASVTAGSLTLHTDSLTVQGGVAAHAEAGNSFSTVFNRSATAESKALLQVNGSVAAMDIGSGGMLVEAICNCGTALTYGAGGVNTATADRSAFIRVTGDLASLTVAGGGVTVRGGNARADAYGSSGANNATEYANAGIDVGGTFQTGSGGIVGNFLLQGGGAFGSGARAYASGAGNNQAVTNGNAEITAGAVNITVAAGDLAISGGSAMASASSGGVASADANALVTVTGAQIFNIAGNVNLTGGSASAIGPGAAVQAITQLSSQAGGDAVVLAAGGNFINNSGNASPITAGRILIYSTIPTSDTLNGMTADFKRYNCTYAAGCLTAGTVVPATGNGFLYSYAPALAVTADAQSKIYGAAEPAFSYTVSGFEFGDDAVTALSGTLGRAAGENVGSYAINQGVLLSPLGYTISLTGNNLGITPASLSVIADALSKVYGSADPVLTYAATGFQFSDTAGTALTGSLSRVAGENVGLYAINQGSLAGANYTITYTGNNLGITAAPAPAPAAPVDVVQPVLNTALDGVLETVALPILNGPLLAAVEQSGEQENPLNKKPTYTCQ